MRAVLMGITQMMRGFVRAKDGYVFVLTLIAMPMLLGLALLIIDVGRGNNLHTDLQNAVDSLALAGAAELDGGVDSIDRAEAAMTDLVKNQARFSNGGPVLIEADEVDWFFLTEIPASDDDPIDADWIDTYGTTDDVEAVYVMVVSHERPMTTLFPVPVGLMRDTVDFAASAVATYDAAVCDITPLFICNPFEPAGMGFEEAFQQGLTYSREFKVLKTSGAPGPGNFGLLNTDIHLTEAFGKGVAGKCYSRRSVETKPGVTYGQVRAGLNTRFDIYKGMNNESKDKAYRPAKNVRKGDKTPGSQGNACNFAEDAADINVAYGFPAGSAGSLPDQPSLGMSGDYWPRTTYWTANHSGAMPPIPSGSHPTDQTKDPSRYDVYRYEIENDLVGDAAKNGETGNPVCYKGDYDDITDQPDRRMIFAAIVNCLEDAEKIAGRTELRPDSFASLFLVAPVNDETGAGGEKPIRLEVVDVTGNSGNGTLNTFMREESYLVR